MIKINKNTIFTFILGILVGTFLLGGIGAVAITLSSDEISYSPTNNKFIVNNAKEALDTIYQIAEYIIPSDTYFYNVNSNDDIIRYKKIDEKYYLCNENGIVINQNEQDITNVNLIEYQSLVSTDIEIGKAGYSSGNINLGSWNNETSTTDLLTTFYVSQGKSDSYTLIDNYESLYLIVTDSRDGYISILIDDVEVNDLIEYIRLDGATTGLGILKVDKRVSKGSVITVKPRGGGSTSMMLSGKK